LESALLKSELLLASNSARLPLRVPQRREHGIDAAGDRGDCIASVNVPLLGAIPSAQGPSLNFASSYRFSSAFPSAIRAEYAEIGRKSRCFS
jgi:hypothetical protein